MTQYQQTIAAFKTNAWNGVAKWSIAAVVFVAGSCFTTGEISNTLAIIAALMLSFLLLAILKLGMVYFGDRTFVRIIPYFEREVTEIDTFVHGHGLSRNLELLDQTAVRCGVLPLSHFGFADDLRGDELTWYSASLCLPTVTALLKEFRAGTSDVLAINGLAMEIAEDTVNDLTLLEDALTKAQQREIQFCFLHRKCSTTSGIEWDARKGTAF